MSNPETVPASVTAGDIADAAASIEPHMSPARVPPQKRFDPGAALLGSIPPASPYPRWIESSRAKMVGGRAVAVHPGSPDSVYVDVADEPIGPVYRQAEAPQPAYAADDAPVAAAVAAKRGLFHGPARKAAALAVALGLCVAAGSFARLGHADTPDATLAAAAEKARAAEASEAKAKQQIAQMSVDMRLISAKVETLRAEIERGRYADDSRGLKRSVDALRSGLESSKSETASTLGQMAQKLDKMQRNGSGERLAQIAERLDRIERRSFVSNDVTGSIARPTATPAPLPVPKPAAIAHASSHQSDGATSSTTRVASLPGPKSISPDRESEAKSDSKPQPKIIPGLVLRDIEGNVAIVEGRGGVFGISRGDFIPGVGRVEGIERRGRDSIVVTSRGVITTHAQR